MQVLINSWVTDTGKRKLKSFDTKNINGKQKQIVNMIKRRIRLKESRLDLEKKYLENSIFEEEITKQYDRLKDSNGQNKRKFEFKNERKSNWKIDLVIMESKTNRM